MTRHKRTGQSVPVVTVYSCTEVTHPAPPLPDTSPTSTPLCPVVNKSGHVVSVAHVEEVGCGHVCFFKILIFIYKL